MRNYLKTLIEHGAYESMELDAIITAQNGIGQILDKITGELKNLSRQLEDTASGEAMDGLKNQISDFLTIVGYFGQLIEDCFGV